MQPIEFSTSGSVGLDFGTTNSAIATVIDSQPALAEFSSGERHHHTFPSVLYFERRKEGTLTRLTSAAGPKALQRYLEAEEKGRLIQSLKAYLGDRRFDGTGVFSQHYSLEDMIALIARHLLVDARGLDRRDITGSHADSVTRRRRQTGSFLQRARSTKMTSSRWDGCAAQSRSAGSPRSCSSTSRWRPLTATNRRSITTSSS